MASSRIPLVVVLGATGTGKSKLALEIGKRFNGQIISADSMQIYKDLHVITNKVTEEELSQCPHHLISCLDAHHLNYNVVDYRDAAVPIIEDLIGKKVLPILVGGTNYYIEGVLWKFLIDQKGLEQKGLDNKLNPSRHKVNGWEDKTTSQLLKQSDPPKSQSQTCPKVGHSAVTCMLPQDWDLSERGMNTDCVVSVPGTCAHLAEKSWPVCTPSPLVSVMTNTLIRDDQATASSLVNKVCMSVAGGGGGHIEDHHDRIPEAISSPCHVITADNLTADESKTTFRSSDEVSSRFVQSSSDGSSTEECRNQRQVFQGLHSEQGVSEIAQRLEHLRGDSEALVQCLYSLSVEELYDHLKQVDAETAARLHPRNIRKIVRAIQVYYQTGRTMSAILLEQHEGSDQVKSGPLRYPDPCVLWVKCQSEVLNQRLDERVDQMVSRGLVAELENFYQEVCKLEVLKENNGSDPGLAYPHGVLQMIGFKEFRQYLELLPELKDGQVGQKLLQQAVTDLKQATRRYAKQQVRWIQNRFCNRPGSKETVPSVYSVDSTDLTKWDSEVAEAVDVVRAFLAGQIPKKFPEKIFPKFDTQLVRNVCELCGGQIFLHLHEWAGHLKSKKHVHNIRTLHKERLRLSKLLSAREHQLESGAETRENFVDQQKPEGAVDRVS